MQWPGTRTFVKKLAAEWTHDALGDTAAALAYYGMLALFPFLLFVVALVGLILDPGSLRNLLSQLEMVAPPQVTQILGQQLESLLKGPHTSILTVGAVTAIWIAAGGVSALMQALDRCYDIQETRPLWKTRALAVGSTLVAGAVSVLAVLVTFAVPLVARWVGGWPGTLIMWARFPVAGLIMLGLWSYFYWALPNVRPRFQLVTPGSIIGVLLWLAASWGFSEYVRHFGRYEATYGALGGMIVLMVWMWASGLVLLLGAEINKILTPQEKLQRSPTGEKRRGKTPAPVAHPEPA
jgi:membrane protein